MKLDDILSEWEKDAKINPTDLFTESLKISELHHKYLKIMTQERLLLRKYESDLKELKMAKYEFFIEGPNEETQKKGWKLPAKGRILKNEVNNYIDTDQEVINLSLKIGVQEEKNSLLNEIIKNINQRSFNIKNSVEWMRFTNGQ